MSDYFLNNNLGLVRTLGESAYLNDLRSLDLWTRGWFPVNAPLITDYTDHGIRHSETIIERIDKLTVYLMDQSDKRLCDVEIYILLTACYLHDIGMHYEHLERLECLKDKCQEHLNIDFSNPRSLVNEEQEIVLKILRDRHHLISYELVKNNTLGIKGLNDDFKEFAASVCLGHRWLTPNEHKDKLPDDYEYDDRHIRLEFLSRILSIGDSLDITFQRADPRVEEIRNIQDQSFIHWFKHHYTRGLDISNHGIHLQFELPCTEEEVKNDDYKKNYKLIPKIALLELKKEQYLHQKYLKDHLYNVFISVVDGIPDVIYNQNIAGYEFVKKPQRYLRTMDNDLLKLVKREYDDVRNKVCSIVGSDNLDFLL